MCEPAPGHEQHAHGDGHEHQGRAQVGLDHDQPGRNGDEGERDQEVTGVQGWLPAGQRGGHGQDHRHLGELGRLQLEGAIWNQAWVPRTSSQRRDHQGQRHEHADVGQPGEVARRR